MGLRLSMAAAMIVAMTAGIGRAQQQTPVAPALPPSNFELRLQELQARQAQRKAQLAERTDSRLRRLTGSGDAAGADATAAGEGGGLDLAFPVKAVIAGIVALAASTALGDDAANDRGGGGGGGGGGSVSSTVSTN